MSSFSSDEYAGRLQRLRIAMEAEQLDAVIAYSTAKVQANVEYLSGYYVRFSGLQSRADGTYAMFGSCAALILLDQDPIVRTDQAWDIHRAVEVSIYPDTDFSDRYADAFGPLLSAAGCRRVGIDNWLLFPAPQYLALKEACPDVEFVGTRLLSEVRRVKSPAELKLMRRAADVAVDAVTAALEAVRVGADEYDIALICESEMRRHGELELGGQSIAGCGANTATGSSVPSPLRRRTMQAGEWYMLDVTPRYESYIADLSRHRVAGAMEDLDPRLRHLYDTCLVMSEEVRGAIKPGVSGLALNRLAEEIASAEGVAQFKIGLLGHGVGLDIHDVPDYYFDDSPWSAGEVVTVEPCLLVAGVGGVRIEDLILVTDDGHEVLTNMPRELTAQA